MTTKKRSDIISSSPSMMMNLFRKGLLHGAGFNTDKLRTRPLIAIANSHTELTTGHSHLDRLARKVHDGVLAAGGESAEFNVPAPCDGVAMAHDGMRFVLAQRDLIADMIETHMRSQPYDGLVVIAGCDKINPAMMMAAARLDLPTIYLSAGPGQMDIRNTAGQRNSIDHGDYGDDALLLSKTATCSTCGACEIMGTANTFQCLAEVFGLCLPGSSNIPGWHADKLEAARRTGERIVEMVKEGLNARQMFTPAAFTNAVRMAMAIGASTNTALHLPAIAQAAEVPLAMSDFEAASDVPTLLAVSPNGPYGIQDLWAAGGMPAVLKQMERFLDTSCMTVTGKPLKATIDAARVINSTVIPPVEKAFRQTARDHGAAGQPRARDGDHQAGGSRPVDAAVQGPRRVLQLGGRGAAGHCRGPHQAGRRRDPALPRSEGSAGHAGDARGDHGAEDEGPEEDRARHRRPVLRCDFRALCRPRVPGGQRRWAHRADRGRRPGGDRHPRPRADAARGRGHAGPAQGGLATA